MQWWLSGDESGEEEDEVVVVVREEYCCWLQEFLDRKVDIERSLGEKMPDWRPEVRKQWTGDMDYSTPDSEATSEPSRSRQRTIDARKSPRGRETSSGLY